MATVGYVDMEKEKHYVLNNIDGMYSHVSDTYGNVFHFAAWTEVNKV